MNRSRLLVTFVGSLVAATSAWGQATQRVSLLASGSQVNGGCFDSAISADGRHVVFMSQASNLVPSDTNGSNDIFIRDRWTGATERVSVDSAGIQGNGGSETPVVSADGRFVAYASSASNLVPGDTNGDWDVFVRDRQMGTTQRVSVASNGTEGNGGSFLPSISGDGRYVAFSTYASTLDPNDANGASDVFVRDLQSGTTELVSLDPTGAFGNNASEWPSISVDGRYVAFGSLATNLVAGDANGVWDIFVRDRQNSATERVSLDSNGVEANGDSSRASISADGSTVGFTSFASNLVAGDANGALDTFVHVRASGLTERVSVSTGGAEASAHSYNASVSSDGRYVAFDTDAGNLVTVDINGAYDTFLRDRQAGTTERLSVHSNGTPGNGGSYSAWVSGDGRFVAFQSAATNLVPLDTNGQSDIFVRDRTGGTSFTSFCEPGAAGVRACPCSNPASGPGRGCENSAGTGGAALTASGGAFISSDSLVFQTTGQLPSELSIVVQGSVAMPAGIAYGQGVRCVGGTLKRMYTRAASNGGISVPIVAGGDPTVAQRSAALGVPITPGQSRLYFVYYRDSTVLGGCPASRDFNATQGGEVAWAP